MQQQRAIFASAQEPKEPIAPGLYKRRLASGASLQISEFFFDPGVEEGGHTHQADEVGYIVAGEFDIRLGNESRRVGPSDSYSLPAGVTHAVKCVRSGSYILVKLRGPDRGGAEHRQG